MLTVLLQSLTVGALGVFSPGAITVVTLLLTSNRGWKNGVSFLIGYMTMYALIGALFLVFGLTSIEDIYSLEGLPTPSPASLISLGVMLLFFGIWNWRKKSSENQGNAHSRFIRFIDNATPFQSFAFAAIIALFNLKNLTIFLSALSVILLSQLLLATKLTLLIPLILVFSASIIMPIVIFFAFPEHSNQYLTTLKNKIDQYNRPLGIAISTIVGLLLLSRGIFGLL